MTGERQVVTIDVSAGTFTAACAACGATFAGRLDLDLSSGVFLCRGGHSVRIERAEPGTASAASATAA